MDFWVLMEPEKQRCSNYYRPTYTYGGNHSDLGEDITTQREIILKRMGSLIEVLFSMNTYQPEKI